MTPRVWLPALRARSGVDVFVRRLSIALTRAGADVTVTWLSRHCEYLPSLLRRVRPPVGTNLIHANSWVGRAFAHWNLPCVVTQHNASVRDPDWTEGSGPAQRLYYALLVQRWEQQSIAAAAAVTVPSRYVLHSLERNYGNPPASVIPHWVDPGVFTPPRGPRAGGPFRLLFVGSLTPRKGADVMLSVARRLGAGFEVRFVGQRARARGGLPDNVTCGPPAASEEAMAEHYRWCDAVLIPSRSEGFGYAALEALACARPVVAARAGALPEIVRDGITGRLCPVGDVEAFADACVALADDAPRRGQMGDAARHDATTRFSEAAGVAAYLEVYRSVLAQ